MNVMPADDFTHDVFLSHSSKDKAVVRTSSLSASNGERKIVLLKTNLSPPEIGV